MNRAVLAVVLGLVTLIPAACRRTPASDTEASRTEEARAFLQILNVRALVESGVDQYAASWPAERRENLRALVRAEARWDDLESAVVAALAKNFSAAEIHALASFQSSPVGKSILGKLPGYQADIVPVLQEETQRLLAKASFAASALRWDAPIQDVTAGPTDEAVAAVFSFRNSGSKTVELVTIATSCGCTTARPEKTVFQPGEKGSIRVLFTRGNRTGLQDERIVVTTDEPEKPSLTLRLRVKIEDPVKVTPRFLVWRSGSAADPQIVTVEIPAKAGVDVFAFDKVPEDFTVQMPPSWNGSSYQAKIAPRSTLHPTLAKIQVRAIAGGGRVILVPMFLRVLPPRPPNRAVNRNGDIIWIDAQPSADDERPRIVGAFPLSEDAWDDEIEPILARWTPDARLVILGQPVGMAARFAERLKTYGLNVVYGLIPIQ